MIPLVISEVHTHLKYPCCNRDYDSRKGEPARQKHDGQDAGPLAAPSLTTPASLLNNQGAGYNMEPRRVSFYDEGRRVSSYSPSSLLLNTQRL